MIVKIDVVVKDGFGSASWRIGFSDTRATSPISDVWSEVIIAVGLSTGAAVALGFSRFAYGLLLPAMRADLGWTYVEAGALNTAIGAGYILGALVAAWTAKRWGMARAFLSGFAASVVVLLLTATTSNFSSSLRCGRLAAFRRR